MNRLIRINQDEWINVNSIDAISIKEYETRVDTFTTNPKEITKYYVVFTVNKYMFDSQNFNTYEEVINWLESELVL